MSNTDIAYIKPAIISWAIQRSGLNYSQIEKSLKATEEQITAWEKGKSYPPFNKAIRLAEILRVPFGYFFLDTPPKLEVPLPDFRTFTDSERISPTLDFLELLNSVLAQHDWYKEYAVEQGAKPLSFVSKFTIKDEVINVAKDIRQTLAMNNGIRKQAGSWSDYLSKLTKSAESKGIIVMRSGVVGNNTKRTLSVNEFQGFAITDPVAPLVFINSRDFDSAKIFTLLHELAHIWIGQSGISNPDEAQIEKLNLTKIQTSKRNAEIESFCNAVAAEALVPKEEFSELIDGRNEIEQFEKLARHFFVSTLVILRRARELDKINVGLFIKLLDEARKRVTVRKKGGGGNYYVTVEARNSSKIFDAVISDVQHGGTTFREAAKLLNMKVPTLAKVVEGKHKS